MLEGRGVRRLVELSCLISQACELHPVLKLNPEYVLEGCSICFGWEGKVQIQRSVPKKPGRYSYFLLISCRLNVSLTVVGRINMA